MCINVTDRQTDRQTTDGRAMAYSERERKFTSANDDDDFISNEYLKVFVTYVSIRYSVNSHDYVAVSHIAHK